ncbi:MAG: hypothetical protein KTR31_19665 [Myxococcales bacterium]|nr:hypothetical protein [Myxococcales bacterium]
MSVGDVVETPHGPRTVVEVRDGGSEAWAADGDSSPWMLAMGARAAERLRVHRSASEVDHGRGYDPIHHTPVSGAPLPASALDWLRSRGAAAMLEDVAWRQDHAELATLATSSRDEGKRPGPPWRALETSFGLGHGPVREGLASMAFVLGFELRVDELGVRLGLRSREASHLWSAGPIQTAAAFRQGVPARGGMQDPELVGDRTVLRYAHVPLPWRMLPAHLLSWVAELLGEEPEAVDARVTEDGAGAIEDELNAALDAAVPRPRTLGGQPLRAKDFLWAEAPVVPGAFRRSVRQEGQRVPHGLDGTLHRLVAEVRNRAKLPDLHPQLEVEMRRRVQEALDGYLTVGPSHVGAWGWSVAQDIQGTLQLDGVMVDWGGHAVALIEPGRRTVGLPRPFSSVLMSAESPEAVLLVRMPDGVDCVHPELVDGPLVRLPLHVAGSLGARTGDLVRVVTAVSQEAQDELEALASGARLSPLVPRPGWLDEVAELSVGKVGEKLATVARLQRLDRCQGPVGSRVWAGILPTPRGDDEEEVERVQRAFSILLRLAEGPGNTMPPGVATERLDQLEQNLGERLVPEIRSLWSVHDGQLVDAGPMLSVDGRDYRLLPLDPSAVADGLVPLAEDDEGRRLHLDAKGRVWQAEMLVTQSLGRLLQVSLAKQVGDRSGG